MRGKDLNLRPLGYEPKLKLPSVALHCPGFPKSSDFIALDCPQFGNKIGDSCPGLPSVAQPIGDRIGNRFRRWVPLASVLASFHEGFSMVSSGPYVKPHPEAEIHLALNAFSIVAIARNSRLG